MNRRGFLRTCLGGIVASPIVAAVPGGSSRQGDDVRADCEFSQLVYAAVRPYIPADVRITLHAFPVSPSMPEWDVLPDGARLTVGMESKTSGWEYHTTLLGLVDGREAVQEWASRIIERAKKAMPSQQ